MATSSVLGLGDIALVWSNVDGAADLSIIDNDIATDRGLVTAALLSLMLDAPAQDGDVPPSGDPNDTRGWWGDEFADVPGDKYGCRLWLLGRAKATQATALLANQYIAEGLQWFLDDKVASSIVPTAEVTTQPTRVGDVVVPAGWLLIGADIYRPGKGPVSFKYAHTWEHVTEGI